MIQKMQPAGKPWLSWRRLENLISSSLSTCSQLSFECRTLKAWACAQLVALHPTSWQCGALHACKRCRARTRTQNLKEIRLLLTARVSSQVSNISRSLEAPDVPLPSRELLPSVLPEDLQNCAQAAPMVRLHFTKVLPYCFELFGEPKIRIRNTSRCQAFLAQFAKMQPCRPM